MLTALHSLGQSWCKFSACQSQAAPKVEVTAAAAVPPPPPAVVAAAAALWSKTSLGPVLVGHLRYYGFKHSSFTVVMHHFMRA